MAVDRSFVDNAELQGLQGDAIIDLYILDLTALGATGNNRFVRFVNWTVADGRPVAYASQQYTAIPMKAGGFNIQTDGVPPNPTITVSNIGLEFTGLVNVWDDLIGARLTRRRVLARHLDSGTNPDGNAHWPDEVWFIQQKEAEQKLMVTFKLSTAFDLDGVFLPRRRALRYTCPWVYRGEGCGYTGPPVANANDEPLTTSATPLLQDIIDTRAALQAERADFQTAQADYGTAQANTANAQAALNNAQNNRNNYSPQWRWQETRFHDPAAYVGEGDGVNEARWGGQGVVLGNEFRRGNYRYTRGRTVRNGRISRTVQVAYYEIEQWFLDDSGRGPLDQAVTNAQNNLTAAQNAEAAAETVYNDAETDYRTAETNYNNAVAAYQAAPPPEPDPQDQCGKRLASCRLRFFDPVTLTYEDLPYGGFPGLTT